MLTPAIRAKVLILQYAQQTRTAARLKCSSLALIASFAEARRYTGDSRRVNGLARDSRKGILADLPR
jgi:hypothetical protein